MRLWYAVMEDRNDTDWGYGSYDRQEAEKMALEMGPEAYIAVINNEGDPVCVEEISQEDFGMKTMYAIRDVAYDYDMTDEPTDHHIFEADNMEDITAELIRIGADNDHYSIEEYRVDADGEFYEQTAMADYFSIPQRTFGNWCTGTRECPEYTKLMMQELLGLYRR